jgi:anaphase-promoting complex subunit 2
MQLVRGAFSELHGDASDCEHEAGEAFAYTRWQPQATNAAQSLFTSDSSSASAPLPPNDIIGMLVSIYGSKELFVNEYKSILADRLLCKTDFDIDDEIGSLELLKLKFGENSLHDCEVMVRDFTISRRVNANVHQRSEGKQNKEVSPGPENQNHLSKLSTIILSKEFWPQLQESDAVPVLPPAIERAMGEFKDSYAVLKHPRYLTYAKHLGTVELELDFADRSLTFNVNPLLASFVSCFDGHTRRSVPQLCDALQLESETVIQGTHMPMCVCVCATVVSWVWFYTYMHACRHALLGGQCRGQRDQRRRDRRYVLRDH